jgi:UPF0755 protein
MTEDEFDNEFKDVTYDTTKTRSFRWFYVVLIALAIVFVFSFYFFSNLAKPPVDFPVDTPVTISEGTTLRSAVSIMKDGGYIRSELALFVYFTIYHESNSIKASTYVFEEPLNLEDLTDKLTKGNYGEGLKKFTHIEGERVELLASRASIAFTNFNEKTFLDLALPFEGRLFPETYLMPDDYTAEELFELLTSTFDEKIDPLQEQINKHNLSLDEIIILASILEREANSPESKKIVSGILQNRLDIGMPLQVDASVEYILNKPLSELMPEDLKIDSPYNTYLNKGLPPTAIGNPGIEAIEAVLEPTPSQYMFYITGTDGEFRYAKNFNEHKRNVARYLR